MGFIRAHLGYTDNVKINIQHATYRVLAVVFSLLSYDALLS